MKIEEQVLSIEQMKHLQELGVDTSDASLCWHWSDEDGGWVLGFMNSLLREISNPSYSDGPFPAYTIADLIEKLPKRIPHKYKRFIDVDLCLYPHIGLEDDGTTTETMRVAYQACDINGKSYWHTLPHASELDLPVKDRLYYALCYIAENYKELLEVNK